MSDQTRGARRFVLASGNAGKLRELRELLAPLHFELVAQTELGIAPADEPHDTFVENALAKARHAAARSGLPALADDSGLCCSALAGAPGVRSARLAGDEASDEANNRELLRLLERETDRRAHYVCVLVALRSADDPEPLIAQARWHGEILGAPRGSGGFGYDPLFWLPALSCSAAELPRAEKNRISHRGLALAQLSAQLQAEWMS
jgi:XTP/dITP diphosphohydrolase